MNGILYEWDQICCAFCIYPNGRMLQEDTIAIKERHQGSNPDAFSAPDRSLVGWEIPYAIKERQHVGELALAVFQKKNPSSPEAYLELSRATMMKIFCENKSR